MDQLTLAVDTSTSISGVLRLLNLKPAGGNHAQIKKYIEEYDLKTDHMTGQGWCVGEKRGYLVKGHTIPLEDILVENSSYSSNRLRKRLIKENIKKNHCEICFLADWLGLPISLELDHINGNHKDNRLANLRILCPNCHAQTPTYRGRNIKKPLDRKVSGFKSQ